MQQLRVEGFTISVDGYGAGPNQSRENPLGVGGESLHEWLVGTRTFAQMQRNAGGSTGIDEDFAARGFDNVGAWIMGRNMFAPSRGPWPDYGWRGWWGKNPPYHMPVYVLTSYARDPIVMEGGTVFHFVTDGIQVTARPKKLPEPGPNSCSQQLTEALIPCSKSKTIKKRDTTVFCRLPHDIHERQK